MFEKKNFLPPTILKMHIYQKNKAFRDGHGVYLYKSIKGWVMSLVYI